MTTENTTQVSPSKDGFLEQFLACSAVSEYLQFRETLLACINSEACPSSLEKRNTIENARYYLGLTERIIDAVQFNPKTTIDAQPISHTIFQIICLIISGAGMCVVIYDQFCK